MAEIQCCNTIKILTGQIPGPTGYVTEELKALKEETKTYRDNAKTSETNAKVSETNAKTSEIQAQGSATQANNYAYQAQQSALAVTPKAYDSDTTYNFPDVVAYIDGETYRCIGQNITGENPSTSPNWVRIAAVKNDFWDIDQEGNLIPAENPTYSEDFELDGEGNIMPR